jgi:hypothetical protein
MRHRKFCETASLEATAAPVELENRTRPGNEKSVKPSTH